MRDAVVLALPSVRPQNFDLATYWKQSTAKLRERQQNITATLALSEEGCRRHRTLVPDGSCFESPRIALPAPRLASLRRSSSKATSRLASSYSGLAPRAAILAPADLCKEIKADIRAMLRPAHLRRPTPKSK